MGTESRLRPSQARVEYGSGVKRRVGVVRSCFSSLAFRALACGIAWAATASAGATPMAALWVEPADLEQRDLFHGPGGPGAAPQPDAEYRFESLETSGHSDGYRVAGPDARTWKVKVGDEVQAEIAVSRILWAIGYHQPSLYFLRTWRMTGGPKAKPAPGRFRLESGVKKEGDWSWSDNPFADTQPLRGLVVVNVLLNNWDLAASNNRIYRVDERGGGPALRFVVQDVGGSLGRSGLPIGTRNRIEDFESQGFVRGVRDGRVAFDWHGRHGGLLRKIGPSDVVWACRLLSRLSDRQLSDAFRAAGYPDDVGSRYVRKIKDKIAQGLALEGAR